MLLSHQKSSAPEPQTTQTLDGLNRGDIGVIVAVTESKTAARLGARGMVPGTELQVLRGGDPLLIGLDGARWALSALDAALVQVEARPRLLRSLLRRFFS